MTPGSSSATSRTGVCGGLIGRTGERYRRFHVIVGDANRSEVATFLKVGTTAIVLSMIEDDQLPIDLALSNPVGAIRQVSHDPALARTVLLKSGRRLSALDVQWQFLEQARKYEREQGLESVGEEASGGLWRAYSSAFPVGYRDLVTPRSAVRDITAIEKLGPEAPFGVSL